MQNFLFEARPQKSSAYRHGFLLVICGLLAWAAYSFETFSPSYRGDRYGNLIIATMLLLNHLAFQYRYSRVTTGTLRIVAVGWLVFACGYVFHLSSFFSAPR